MSGFEVAGVLLGAFPLLISAFEHYRDVAKVANLLTNFEAEYRRSWNDAKDEELAFRLTIKRLILPLVNDEAIEGDDVEGLLADPGGPAWGSVDVGDALRARLGEAFGRYVDIMEGLQGCVLKLLDSLGVKRKRFQDKLNKMSGSSNSPTDPSKSKLALLLAANKECLKSTWDYRTQQIKYGLGRPYREELLAEIRLKNEKLDKLLKQSDEVCRLQESKTTVVSARASKSLLQYWEHAGRIYTLVQASWGCKCKQSHCAHLWLHHPKSGGAFELKLLVLWAPHGSSTDNLPPWRQQGLHITWVKGDLLDDDLRALLSAKARPPLQVTPAPHDPSKQACKKQKRVNFAVHHSGAAASQPCGNCLPSISLPAAHDQKIDHLCAQVASCGMNRSHLGALHDSAQGLQYSVFSQPEQKLSTIEISLADVLLFTDKRRLRKRSDRFQIALAVSSAHLQLHSTPWARRQWDAKAILFPQDIHDETRILFDRPYISANFDDAVSGPEETPKQTDRSFACLGIMLLELLFELPLEHCELWAALGLEKLIKNTEIRAMVASKWADQVEDEAGSDFAAAVTWCLRESPTTLDGSQWRKDLADRVVLPLQNCCEWIKKKPTP